MRSLQLQTIITFLILYALIIFIAQMGIRLLSEKFKKVKTRKFLWLFFIPSVINLILFFVFYVYPLSSRTSRCYQVYFWFNYILLADLLVKTIVALGYLSRRLFLKRDRVWPVICAFILSAGILLVMATAILDFPCKIRTRKHTLTFNDLPEGFSDFRILHFSDLHLGSLRNNSPEVLKLEAAIIEYKPDLIVFTGDLFNNFSEESEGFDLSFLIHSAPSGVYGVLGNHDYGNYYHWKTEAEKAANFQGILETYKKSGIRLLLNENERITSRGDTISLIGVENWGYPPFPQHADLNKALKGVPKNSFKILLTHDPAHWDHFVAGTDYIQLALSGHTHGLQWGIKLAGIEFSLMKMVRSHWGGLYREGNSLLYVNRGLGTIGFPARIDMPAEITILTLRKR